MPRLLHPLAATLVLAGAASLAGCNHVMLPRTTAVQSSRPATYAISVSLAGGLQPTATQWAAVQSSFARILAREGIVLVSDLGLADRILRIEFTPDPADPENRGQATILSIRANPHVGTSSAPAPLLADDLTFPSPFAWGWDGFPLFPGYGRYFGYASYYGYGNAYYDGYSYSAPTLNPRRPHHDGPHAHCAPRKHDHPGTPERPPRPEPPEGKRPPLLAATSPSPAALVVYPSPDRASSMFQDDIRLNRPHRSLADAAEARSQYARSRTERGSTEGEPSRSWLGRTLAAADAGAAASTSGQRPAGRYEGSNSSGERSWSRQESSAGRTEHQHHGESSPRNSGGSSSSYSSSSGSTSSNSSSSSGYSSSSNTSSSSSYNSSSSSGSSSYSGSSSSSYSSSSASSSSASSGGSSSSSSSSSGSTGSNRVER